MYHCIESVMEDQPAESSGSSNLDHKDKASEES